MLTFLQQILQLILRPYNGWEDVAASFDLNPDDVERFYRGAFLPLIVACSLSSLFRMVYGADFLGALAHGLVMFVALFLSYYVSCWVFDSYMRLLSDNDDYDIGRYRLMSMYVLAIVSLLGLLVNIVKVHLAILDFLPLYTIFILWKGCRFAGVDSKNEGLFMLMSTGCILGSYYGLSFIFNSLI